MNFNIEPDATSTPVKENPTFDQTSLQPGKHYLTPESKAAAESKPKRFAGLSVRNEILRIKSRIKCRILALKIVY